MDLGHVFVVGDKVTTVVLKCLNEGLFDDYINFTYCINPKVKFSHVS